MEREPGDEVVFSWIQRGEPHPRHRHQPRLLRKHLHIPQPPQHLRVRPGHLQHPALRPREQRLQRERATRMRQIPTHQPRPTPGT
jgi:hypothetical protein